MSRTIFLFIRGVDQTGRAFASADKNLTNLQRKQRELLRSAYRLLFAGAAFALFAVKTSQGILSLMERTSQGALVVDDFRRSWDRLLDKLSEKFTEHATPWIDKLIKGMDYLTDHPWILDWTVKLGLGLTGLAALGAVGTLGLAGLKTGAAVLLKILEVIGLKSFLEALFSLGGKSTGKQMTLDAFVEGAGSGVSAYELILPALKISLPVIVSILASWGTITWLGKQREKLNEIIDHIKAEGPQGEYVTARADLMGDLGYTGTDPLDPETGIGAGWGIGAPQGYNPLTVNVDVHDNEIVTDDADSVGTNIGVPIADQLLNYVDRKWR
jgi:hypothetical protein